MAFLKGHNKKALEHGKDYQSNTDEGWVHIHPVPGSYNYNYDYNYDNNYDNNYGYDYIRKLKPLPQVTTQRITPRAEALGPHHPSSSKPDAPTTTRPMEPVCKDICRTCEESKICNRDIPNLCCDEGCNYDSDCGKECPKCRFRYGAYYLCSK